jgi:SAM-dependent methyltransferase
MELARSRTTARGSARELASRPFVSSTRPRLEIGSLVATVDEYDSPSRLAGCGDGRALMTRAENGSLATRTPVRGKTELILELCRGKNVLDLGCVLHSWRMSLEQPNWLHREIDNVAASCTGVDFLADDVRELRERGYNIVVGDVLKDPPPGRYEVVVAGDLIEHLDNPGVLLDYVHDALTDDGIAVVTTPNAHYIAQTWTILARGKPDMNPEHAVIFDPFTLKNLVARSPLRIKEFYWLEPSWPALWNSRPPFAQLVSKPLHLLTRAIIRARPYLNSDFGVVLEKRPDARPQFDPQASGEDVMSYLHGRRERH